MSRTRGYPGHSYERLRTRIESMCGFRPAVVSVARTTSWRLTDGGECWLTRRPQPHRGVADIQRARNPPRMCSPEPSTMSTLPAMLLSVPTERTVTDPRAATSVTLPVAPMRAAEPWALAGANDQVPTSALSERQIPSRRCGSGGDADAMALGASRTATAGPSVGPHAALATACESPRGGARTPSVSQAANAPTTSASAMVKGRNASPIQNH